MRTQFLPFSRPSIGEEEIAEVVDTLRSEWITTGPKVKRFEQEFASAVEAPAALAVSSGTAALHLALVSQRIGWGDAVITTPMTFCSTVHAIEQARACPILVDVEPDTLNIDPVRVADEVAHRHKQRPGESVKAILPVHLAGHPCEMSSLLNIAQDKNLIVIEDAAHAIAAAYRGRAIGSTPQFCTVPLLTCFSFHATNSLTTAEGGMLTGPLEAVDEARLWSLHGMSRDAWNRYSAEGSWYYEVVRPGFKYNMTDVQASIGLQQLRKQSVFRDRRAEIARRYDSAFSAFESLQIPAQRAEVDHAWHLYMLRLHLDLLSISRRQFIEGLADRRIESSVHFIPIHLHPYFRTRYGYKAEDFPVASREYQRIVSLPMYPGMSDRDVEDVIGAVIAVARDHTRRTLVQGVAPMEPVGIESKVRIKGRAAGRIRTAARRAFGILSNVGMIVRSAFFPNAPAP